MMKYLGIDYNWYRKIMFYILRKFYKYKPPHYNDREFYIKTLEKCFEIIDEKNLRTTNLYNHESQLDDLKNVIKDIKNKKKVIVLN